jgi:1,4-dihydroxy-2-naphthoate octaprenyltransferase
LRDRETDLVSGKRTLAVRLGEKKARCVSTRFAGAGLPLLPAAHSVRRGPLVHSADPGSARRWPYGWRQKAARLRGRPLNQVLAQTGQLELIFCLLYALGLLLV